MDNLRGRFSHGSGLDDDAVDQDLPEDESTGELPPAAIGQDERRMQVRAYNFWASLLEDRNFPAIATLRPADQVDFGPCSVLLDFTRSQDNPGVVYLGEKLRAECDAPGEIARLSDVPSRSLLSRITDHYLQILANQAPIGFEAEFVNQRGDTILYRGILLPFSSNDATIDHIYGVINWKQLADQKTTDELLLQIDQVLEPRKDKDRAHLPMTGWADGPVDISGILDLAAANEVPMSGFELPEPAFGGDPDSAQTGDGASLNLRDCLTSARELAKLAALGEDRSRQALYAAIGRAYDFSLAAAADPEEFEAIVAEAGLTVQQRAPMLPLVKLVFGKSYDKTRLTEYASVLAHARRIALDSGALAAYLGAFPGGLKGIIGEERKLRRQESGARSAVATAPREKWARKLRALDAHEFSEIETTGEEFTLLVARRLASGEVVLLGEVGDDAQLLERAARRLLEPVPKPAG